MKEKLLTIFSLVLDINEKTSKSANIEITGHRDNCIVTINDVKKFPERGRVVGFDVRFDGKIADEVIELLEATLSENINS